MTIVRNNHDGRLTVAGVSIRPGGAVDVPNWTPELASASEKAFLDLKKIEVIEPAVEERPADKKAKG